MSNLKVVKESLPTRCEICHQEDQWDGKNCSRCANVNTVFFWSSHWVVVVKGNTREFRRICKPKEVPNWWQKLKCRFGFHYMLKIVLVITDWDNPGERQLGREDCICSYCDHSSTDSSDYGIDREKDYKRLIALVYSQPCDKDLFT